MLWIPVTIFAAAAQTVRNAAQRSLVSELGTLGATLVRFLYGLPFALAWALAVVLFTGVRLPAMGATFGIWVLGGAIAQIAATALLLQTMRERNFAIGVAYSKTELVQVAIFSLVLLGDALDARLGVAVVCGMLGVMMLSPADKEHPWRSMAAGFASRSALLGIGSGAGFALSAVAFRGAIQQLDVPSQLVAASLALVVAQTLQTLLLGGWLLARSPDVVQRTLRAWRRSLFAGAMGAAASAGWFTAFALVSATKVRTLGLVEILFSYAVSRNLFREQLSRREFMGIVLLTLGALLAAVG